MKKILFGLLALTLLIAGCVHETPEVICKGEYEHVIQGTAYSDQECCEGLVAKAPDGFVGGAWCVGLDCVVICTDEYANEGIVAKCPNGDIIFLKEIACPEVEEVTPWGVGGITAEMCVESGGNWNDCANRCAIDNQGKTGVACANECEALCECGGVDYWTCPEWFICHKPRDVMDAVGYCEPSLMLSSCDELDAKWKSGEITMAYYLEHMELLGCVEPQQEPQEEPNDFTCDEIEAKWKSGEITMESYLAQVEILGCAGADTTPSTDKCDELDEQWKSGEISMDEYLAQVEVLGCG